MLRREDERLITGRGRYTDDWEAPGALHAYFLRSDRAHARIASVQADAARTMRGVAAVFTGADFAGLVWPPSHVSYPGRGGKPILHPKRAVVATDRVRFVGELIALIVADSAALAQDAAEAVAVRYDALPVVVDGAAALAPGAPQLFDDIPSNVAFDYETGDAAAVEAALARAAHVVRVRHESQRLVAAPMEPRACIAAFDAAAGEYTIHVSTQGMPMMRAHLAQMMCVPPEKLRIVVQDVGGGFGMRSTADPEYAAALLAARRLGRTVRWVATRTESFLSDSQGRGNTLEGALALDRDGRFLALRFDMVTNLGAYHTPTGPLVNTVNPTLCAGGVYAIPALYGRAVQVLTNVAPMGAYRGAGRPDIAYLIERLVDEAAVRFGFDPVALRRKNFIPPDAFPFKTANGATYDSGDYASLLDRALAAAEWERFAERRAEAARRGRLRGIGLATFVEPAGGGPAAEEQAAIRFLSGERIALYLQTQSTGQGHETTFPALASDILGIPIERFELRVGDPGVMGVGSFGSRSLALAGSALKMAAEKVIEHGRAAAAARLGAAASAVAFESGRYVVQSRAVSLLELAAEARGTPHPLDAVGAVPVSRTFPSGCQVAEVEIDPETGELAVVAHVAIDDCGHVVNHTVVEGQVHGGIAQGAGQVLGEHCVYDAASGQLLTASFLDYYMPRADTLPSFVAEERNVPSPNNPLGAKGVGESGTTGALPALMNAILDAVRTAGVTHLDMPVTPARLWAALEGVRRRAREGSEAG
jgi:carbon-monoxide dehydrogenase large subunit